METNNNNNKKQVVAKKAAPVVAAKGEVLIVATDKNSFMKTGSTYPVSPEMAKTLIKKGFATSKK